MYKALSNTFVRALFLLNNSVVKKQNVKVISGQALMSAEPKTTYKLSEKP